MKNVLDLVKLKSYFSRTIFTQEKFHKNQNVKLFQTLTWITILSLGRKSNVNVSVFDGADPPVWFDEVEPFLDLEPDLDRLDLPIFVIKFKKS